MSLVIVVSCVHAAGAEPCEALIKAAEYDKALQCLESSQESAKQEERSWILKASLLLNLARYHEGLYAIDRAISMSKDPSSLAWELRGRLLEAVNDPFTALDSYESALSINDSRVQAWTRKGIVLMTLGRIDNAITALDQAITISPHDREAWYYKGAALERIGDLDGALKCLRKACVLGMIEGWGAQSIVLRKLGRPALALDCVNRALAVEGSSKTNLLSKVAAMIDLGMNSEALAYLCTAIGYYPDSSELWIYTAHALRGACEGQRALEAIDYAIDLDPNLAEAWIHKSIILSEIGSLEESLDSLEMAEALGAHEYDQEK